MREFTNPPLASAPPVGGLADAVYDHALEDPLYPALGRKDEHGAWRNVTSAEFRDEVLALAKGLLAHAPRRNRDERDNSRVEAMKQLGRVRQRAKTVIEDRQRDHHEHRRQYETE